MSYHVCKVLAGQAPCMPSKPRAECVHCERRRLHRPVNSRVLVIDASVMLWKAGCPMKPALVSA